MSESQVIRAAHLIRVYAMAARLSATRPQSTIDALDEEFKRVSK